MSPSKDPAERPDADDITQLCGLAQTAFYALLGFLAFYAVVILSTTDSDFLIGSKQTEIPLIKVAVPTERFFFLAPLVGTVLYAHLHLYCIKLWVAVSEPKPGAVKEADLKSLIGDITRYFCPGTRPRGGDHWADLGTLVAVALVWLAHPLLLIWALARSQASGRIPDPRETIEWWQILPQTVHEMTILCLAVSAAIGVASLLAALAIRRRGVTWTVSAIAVAAAFAVPFLAGDRIARAQLRPVEIDRENLVGLGPDWPRAEERLTKFRKEWCKDRGVEPAVCGNMHAASGAHARQIAELREKACRREARCATFFARLDADFAAEWQAQRTAELDRLPQLNLNRRDLAGASAVGTRFIAARMDHAVLSGARLKDADFEGANLFGARLDGADAYYTTFDRANLSGAHLELADLASSSFEGATLRDADFTGAKLVEADLGSVDLSGAMLTGANLTRARLGRANLANARLNGAILTGADLSGAVGLTQYLLATAIGDETTRLPYPPEGDKPLSVVSCWKAVPAQLSEALATLPEGRQTSLAGEALRAQICDRTETPRTISGPPRPERRMAGPNYEAIRRAYEDSRRHEQDQVRRPPHTPIPVQPATQAPPGRLSSLVVGDPPRPRPAEMTVSARNLP